MCARLAGRARPNAARMPSKRNIILNRSQGESKDHNDELDALDCSSWLLACRKPLARTRTLPQFESKVQIAF